MSKFYNKTASALIKTGAGKLRGVFVSTASGSPTIQFVDGITDNDDVIDTATGVLTSTGAMVPGAHAVSEIVSSGACAPAEYANTILTSDATNFSDAVAATAVLTSDLTEVTDGDTVTIGTGANERIYRFKDTMAQAYDVKRDGATPDTTLANLAAAINGTGTAGVEWYAGTVLHPDVSSSAVASNALTLSAKVAGAAGNNIAKAESSSHLDFDGAGAEFTGGLDAETVTIGSIVYRFKNTMLAAYDVKIGVSAAVSLDNLKAAINGTGTAGVEWYTGTVVHPDVIATTNTDTQQTIFARTIGTVPNTKATTETCAHASFPDTTLGGGTGDSNPGVATTSATITLGSTVYTAVLRLAESIGLTAVPYQVLWETSEAVFLDNLKVAVNAGAGAGTKYGTGTAAHATVIAYTNTNTVQTFTARTIGTAANSMATTTTLANYAFADTTLGGGTGNSNPGVATSAATVTINGRVYTIVQELSETSGATAVVDQVLHGAAVADMLDNLKLAINAGATAGTNYSTGTVVNADVSATTNTDTAQTIASLVAGTVGNAITTTETMANTAWGAATLTGGLEVNLMLIEAFVGVAGTMYTFPDPAFNTGLQLRISGTAEVTVFVD